MKKKMLIILPLTLAILVMTTIVISAAYYFHRETKDEEVGLASLTIDNKSFLNYSDGVDDDFNAKRKSTPAEVNETKITCYASKKHGYSDELEYDYLNQIGLKFSFTNTTLVYVRLQIRDTWTSRKVYTNSVITNTYTNKPSTSPFAITDSNWKFDASTNCAYLKLPVAASSESHSYSFDVDSTYYAEPETNISYRESIMVNVQFSIDIVQANRASNVWGIDNLDEFLNS